MLLPYLGGVPAVWNTCMVFFQFVLLAGYTASNYLSRFKPRVQVATHLAVVALSFIFLPVAIPAGWAPPAEGRPVFALLILLFAAVGLPFFTLSMSAPLFQKWFSGSGRRGASDPYFLYAASNAGSLIAVLAYPFFIEPAWTIRDQSRLWAWGFLLWGLITVWIYPKNALKPAVNAPAPRIAAGRKLRWLFLALVPSSAMLGLTTYITTDIASIPLIWIVPLGLYLLSFIIVFSRRPIFSHGATLRALTVAVSLLAMTMAARFTDPVTLPLHALTFFLVSLACHGELAKDRPGTENLTEFYLWMSAGGVLGGMFNALLAPVLFLRPVEYALAIAASCLCVRFVPKRSDLLAGAIFGAAVWGLHRAFLFGDIERYPAPVFAALFILIFCLPVGVLLVFSARPPRLALAAGLFMLLGIAAPAGQESLLRAGRSFFGISVIKEQQVPEQGTFRFLMHGTTVHGIQSLDPAHRNEPFCVFHRSGPAGLIFSVHQSVSTNPNVAVIGLGAGSLASYGKKGEQWDYFEIDPVVKEFAGDFTFLRDSQASWHVTMGDGRLSLTRQPDKRYGLIVLDAFSSDSIPVHLMTHEAIRLYLSKLDSGGLLVFNISNRYLKLERVLSVLARDAGLAGVLIRDVRPGSKRSKVYYDPIQPSDWYVMARDPKDLQPFAADPRVLVVPASPDARPWTDDCSNVLSAL